MAACADPIKTRLCKNLILFKSNFKINLILAIVLTVKHSNCELVFYLLRQKLVEGNPSRDLMLPSAAVVKISWLFLA